jgi:formylglycine-generating enzyme required for sulfatase activity
MKAYFFPVLLSSFLTLLPSHASAEASGAFVFETARELFASGDFDGDGHADIAIVDKESGKIRLGYQLDTGLFAWVDNRPSGIKGVTSIAIGKLTAAKGESIVLTGPDANQVSLVDVSNRGSSAKPQILPFEAGLGPSVVAALDIGGSGNTPAADIFVGSIYNSPDANLATLLRNDGGEYPKISEAVLADVPSKANRLTLKPGSPDYVVLLIGRDALKVESVDTGKLVEVAGVAGLPAGSDYCIGSFRSETSRDFLIFKPGEGQISFRPLTESGPGKLEFGKAESYDLGQPVKALLPLNRPKVPGFIAFFGEGQTAGLFTFDGAKAPKLVQTLSATNDVFTSAAPTPKGLIVFTQSPTGKSSNRYQFYNWSGEACSPGVYGSLASLTDNDNITIPDIHARIVSKIAEKTEPEMQAYTNTIPGTRATYAMIPIPSGEFTMGSPDSEPNRQPDEGPQHTVKLEPFWMGQCEITWNEYELFMYPDEERRTRGTVPSDADGDKLADAITHPSKPYVEMSFGMGKDGYPAIAMTQHAANKYCQWLSAKTGHFYRLPTEAEWEYACRAGTKTAYYFGDDAAQLPNYGWFEENSDFKYQKVGKKKPNPWGLYDMCGNVVEWVLDQYDPEYYRVSAQQGAVTAPWNKATKPYPHSARGGSWDDAAVKCRSAARRGSDRSWKMQDPQLPKSVWYFSDAQFVGFRIVRPLKVPAAGELQKYWTSGVERD